MKKILYLLAIPAAALALSTSCSNLNTYPVFDDANAFVSFGQVAVTVSEDAGYVEIPIVLSSVAGISTTITYELVNGEGETGAQAGTDFVIPDDCTATFSADHRIDTISIQIIDRPGEYTRDLSFSVRLSNTGTVTDGAANTCTVTITDLDHPLAYIIGSYTATSANGAKWTMTLSPDEGDDTMIWFYDICNFASWAGDDMLYYGVVNTESNTISIPLGQSSEYVYDNENPVLLVGMEDIPDMPGYINIYDGGNITVNISDNGNQLEFVDDIQYLGGYIKDAGTVAITPLPFICTKQ